MSLTGEKDDVARFSGANGALDGGAAILFDDEGRVGLSNTRDDLVDDGRRPLAARVVAGDDDEIAGFGSDTAHLRALGTVAIAAAAEEGDDTAVVDADALAGEADQIL